MRKKIDGLEATLLVILVMVAASTGLYIWYSPEPTFYIQAEEVFNEDILKINAFIFNTSTPLPDVTVAVYEHGVERLLSGPQMTNEQGYAFIEVPKGYNTYFDIVADYKGERKSLTIDRRGWLIKLEDKLGLVGIAILTIFIGSLFTCLGRWSRRYFKI